MIRIELFANPIWEGTIRLNNKLLTHLFERSKKMNYLAYNKSSIDGS